MLKILCTTAALVSTLLMAREPNIFHNSERISWFKKQVAENKNPAEKPWLMFMLGREYIFAGKNEEAIKILEGIKKIYNAREIVDFEDQKITYEDLIEFNIGLAYFRIGEQENCVGMNNDHTCIFPIMGKGVHMKRLGSEKSQKYFSEILKRNPSHAPSRWLLNLGHNTLGTYPEGVPAKYLISPALFHSEARYERFLDKAMFMGVNYTSLAGGVVVDDFDDDGKFDIFYSSVSPGSPGSPGTSGSSENHVDGSYKVYLNAKEKMKDVTALSKAAGIKGSLDIFSADYNNDGNLDIYLSRGAWKRVDGEQPGILLRGAGKGRFENATGTSGIKTTGPSQAASWGDFNNDGFADLFVAYESEEGKIYPTQLWKNNGNGTFTDIAKEAGLANLQGYFKAAVWGDFNNDGLIDLMISNLKGPSYLMKNEGPDKTGRWKFSDVTRTAGLTEPKQTFPTWFFDYDNDGWEDIFLAGYEVTMEDIIKDFERKHNGGEKIFLYRNNRNGTFTNVAAQVNLNKIVPAMGANFGDINNDGYLDFYCGTGAPPLEYIIPNRMFLNAGGKQFKDVTSATGTGHIQKGHGVAFADMNDDGAVDLVINQGGFFEADFFKKYVFINPGTSNNWIRVKLEGRKTNRAALGARLKVTVVENGKERFIYRTINTGGSFGANPLEQHIGIGSAKTVKQVQVYWPVTKKYQTMDNIAANKRIRIVEL